VIYKLFIYSSGIIQPINYSYLLVTDPPHAFSGTVK